MKRIILFISVFIIQSVSFIFASQEINTRIDIGENAINLFLSEQYNRINNKISGSISGVNYNITLQLPYVKLFNGEAKVFFGFKIDSNIYNGVIEIDDNVTFKIASIDNISIRGISEAFGRKIESLNLNPVLKNAIISAWASLQLEIYPMNLAHKINNSAWLAERAIDIVDPYFSIGFNCIINKLQVTLSSYLDKSDFYLVGPFRVDKKNYLKFNCCTEVSVKEIRVYTTGGSLLVNQTDLGTCPKKGVLLVESPFLNKFSTGTYFIVNVLFENKNTFYVRNYKCIAGLNACSQPSKKIN